jgi:hypothetical protein
MSSQLMEGGMVINLVRKSEKDRVERVLLVALILLVQVTWGAGLVYLAVHFL